MIRALMFSKENNCINQIAAAWLQSFNQDISVKATGEERSTTLSIGVKKAMKEVGIEWSGNHIIDFKESIQLNWDYVFIVNHCIQANDKRFMGNILHWIEMPLKESYTILPNDSSKEEHYAQVRDSLRYQVLQTYLTTIGGKVMIGADSCGAECHV